MAQMSKYWLSVVKLIIEKTECARESLKPTGPQHFCLILNNNSVNSSSCLQYTHQAWIDARPLIQDLPSLLKIIQTGSASRQVVPLRLLSGGLPVHGRRQTVCIFAILTLKYNAWHTHTHTHTLKACCATISACCHSFLICLKPKYCT